MTVEKLMDVLQDPSSCASNIKDARAEIRLRTESAPYVSTPQAILMRTVEELRLSGRFDLAHACLVVFAGAAPDPALLLPTGFVVGNSDAIGLVAWLIGRARGWGETLEGLNMGCRPSVNAAIL